MAEVGENETDIAQATLSCVFSPSAWEHSGTLTPVFQRCFLSLYCLWKLGKRLVTGSNVEQTSIMQEWDALGFSSSRTRVTIPAISCEIWCKLNFIVCLFTERRIRLECGFCHRVSMFAV